MSTARTARNEEVSADDLWNIATRDSAQEEHEKCNHEEARLDDGVMSCVKCGHVIRRGVRPRPAEATASEPGGEK